MTETKPPPHAPVSETLTVVIPFPPGAYSDDTFRLEVSKLAEEARDRELERRGWVATSELTCEVIGLPTAEEPYCRAIYTCTAAPKELTAGYSFDVFGNDLGGKF